MKKSFCMAISQMPISSEASINGKKIREHMRIAAASSARLIQFSEGALSGYAVETISDWSQVDWSSVRAELKAISSLAKALRIWVVLGSAHILTASNRPHNSLYIFSDEGQIINRYDKRFCSHTETTQFYSPGVDPCVFDVDGFRFGCIICIEINFPSLLNQYARLGVDCLLVSAYPVDKIFYTKARALAAIYIVWIGLSVPSECANLMMSALIGPNGDAVQQAQSKEAVVIAEIDPEAAEFSTALLKSRQWRNEAKSGHFYTKWLVTDARSSDKTCL